MRWVRTFVLTGLAFAALLTGAAGATANALPSSGKVTEHAPFTVPGALLAGEAQTGQSTFSIALKKTGTASGYVEVDFTYPLLPSQSTPDTCTGKVSFTGKLA
jgi:hypothetical protein